MMLDDINSDNVSDLAITSAAKIVVLKSRQRTDYRLHLTIKAEAGFSIKLTEIVPDSDKDGMRELAYFQEKQPEQNEHMSHSARHLLCAQSLEDGKYLFKADLQGTAYAHDLACGDFNGDGCPIRLAAGLHGGRAQTGRAGSELWVLSGKDGASFGSGSYDERTAIATGASAATNCRP